ncbi:Uncharacterised protein [Morganella morganii]|nr:Uncharacterised protein [Morganella morganii]
MTSYSRIILQLTVVLIVLSAGGLLYSQWPSLLHVSAKLQKELNFEMAALIQNVVSDPLKAGGLLTLFSFYTAYCTHWVPATVKLSFLLTSPHIRQNYATARY